MKGYFGIGVYRSKTVENIGTLWRSAFIFGASFIFVIGERYKKQPSDTMKTPNNIPLFTYETYEDFIKAKPKEAQLVIIEQGGKSIKEIKHPKQAIYLLGSEDEGIPTEYFKGNTVVELPTNHHNSLNVAVAGSIVLYDRFIN